MQTPITSEKTLRLLRSVSYAMQVLTRHRLMAGGSNFAGCPNPQDEPLETFEDGCARFQLLVLVEPARQRSVARICKDIETFLAETYNVGDSLRVSAQRSDDDVTEFFVSFYCY